MRDRTTGLKRQPGRALAQLVAVLLRGRHTADTVPLPRTKSWLRGVRQTQPASEHRLLQPVRSEGRRRRPGYFQVTRPDELWHLAMTSIWVAEHGWTYLNAAIDCCTREITGWALDVRCRAPEATAVIDRAAAIRG